KAALTQFPAHPRDGRVRIAAKQSDNLRSALGVELFHLLENIVVLPVKRAMAAHIAITHRDAHKQLDVGQRVIVGAPTGFAPLRQPRLQLFHCFWWDAGLGQKIAKLPGLCGGQRHDRLRRFANSTTPPSGGLTMVSICAASCSKAWRISGRY